MRRISEHVDDGMNSGFFELKICGSIGRNGKRVVDIKYAPNERFKVHPDELQEY